MTRTLAVKFLALALMAAGCSTPTTQATAAPAPTCETASTSLPSETEIVAAIRGSDDLDLHKAALVNGSRLFLAHGGTLSDLRAMGGWIRSQFHKPRRVYFTYKQPGDHVSLRWYFDMDSGKLFQ